MKPARNLVFLFCLFSFWSDPVFSQSDAVRIGLFLTEIQEINNKEDFKIGFWLWGKMKCNDDSSVNIMQGQLSSVIKGIMPVDVQEFQFVDSVSVYLNAGHELYHAKKGILGVKNISAIAEYPLDEINLSLLFDLNSPSGVFPLKLDTLNFEALYNIDGTEKADRSKAQFFLSKTLQLSQAPTLELKTIESEFNFHSPDENYLDRLVCSVQLQRRTNLFLKLHFALFVALAFGLLSIVLPSTRLEMKLTLLLTGVTAVIGNKFTIEQSMPDTDQVTLTDVIHAATLIVLLLISVFEVLKSEHVFSNKRAYMSFIFILVMTYILMILNFYWKKDW